MDAAQGAQISLVIAGVILVAVIGVRLASRLGLPGLLIYLLMGLAISDDGLGKVAFQDVELATVLGYAALIVILAEGGLTTRPENVRPVIGPGIILGTVGVALSILIVAVPLVVLGGLDARTAALIGAVLAPTDAAAVFTVARGMRLPVRLQTLLEAESGLNDAPVVVLVVLLSSTAGHELPGWALPIVVVAELVGGLLVGAGVGLLARWLLPRLALPAAGLYPIAVVALLLLAYGAATLVHCSGFAAVYVVALILAASQLPHRRSVLGFIEGLAWSVQIGLFIMLGLLAVPSRLGSVVGLALGTGLVLLILARPLSVVASLWPFMRPGRLARALGVEPMPWQWMAFTGWAGLRGAVPIIFATIPLGEGVAQGELIFDVTLLLVILLTVVQSPTMPPLAHRLGLVTADRPGELTVEAAPLDSMRAALLDLDVQAGSQLSGTYVSELPLPPGAVVSLVIRGPDTLVPDRFTRLRRGDRLLVVVTDEARPATERALRAVSEGGRLAGWSEVEAAKAAAGEARRPRRPAGGGGGQDSASGHGGARPEGAGPRR
jgi:potassium/hydrogen antiporter